MASFKRHCLATLNNYIPFTKLIKPKTPRILMYHRIIDPKDVPYPLEPGMYVTPKTFEMQIEFLSKNYTIVHLEEYIANFENAKKNKLVALTFDDGWVDFYDNAYPVLKAYNAPAIVFLPTAFIGTNELFWTDKLAYYLANLNTKTLIEAFGFSDDLGAIINKLKQSQHTRKEFMQALENLSGQTAEKLKNLTPQFLTWIEVTELSKNSLIKFGSHSHAHNISTEINEDEFSIDLKTANLQFIDHNIEFSEVFCYPNQMRNSITDKIVKQTGFNYSLGILNKDESSDSTDPNCFSRIGVHEDMTNSQKIFRIRIDLGL